MVWIEPKSKKPYILDGHQRINVIKSLNGTPYELPYIEIAAKNKNEAKKKLALVNSQYGKITRDGWDSFMHDVDKDWVRGMTTLEAFTLPPLEGAFCELSAAQLNDFFEPVNNDANSEYENNADKNKCQIILNYSEEDYNLVMEAFKKHSGSKENIIYKLLGL